jgi:hypothetical protein
LSEINTFSLREFSMLSDIVVSMLYAKVAATSADRPLEATRVTRWVLLTQAYFVPILYGD